MRMCSIGECERVHYAKGFCNFHYQRAYVYRCDEIEKPIRRSNGMGYIQDNGYIKMTVDGESDLQHIVVAEKALRKALPKGAQVHHVDGDKGNNDPKNLVVCPDAAYHRLLHKRQQALEECGHADWLKCRHCKEWDTPHRLLMTKGRPSDGIHRECARQKSRHRRATLRADTSIGA